VAVDRGWVARNLGLQRPPADAIAAPDAAVDDQAFARELIEFDSEGPEGTQFAEVASRATGLSKFVDPEWPDGLEPRPGPKPAGPSLPRADVLMVTWTVDEGHALSRVLTPGFDSRNDWVAYTKNYDEIAKQMVPQAPARQAHRLGTYWTTSIGDQAVTLFKSDSHMSQDGPDLVNATVWKQIIEDTQPRLVISTGTGGGIGPTAQVGDVIVSRFVTFDCQRRFKRLNGQSYACRTATSTTRLKTAQDLFVANQKFLPTDNTRSPLIDQAVSAVTGILTTDFFGFDNTANTFGLQGKGALSEMGDAVLGMVADEMGTDAPSYVIVRNVSDPEIDSTGETLSQQASLAADIYKGFGRWSSVCSAIVCWALTAGL
jgi:nucleoside phosphorylase